MLQLQVEEKTVIPHLSQNTFWKKAFRTSSKRAKEGRTSPNLELSWEVLDDKHTHGQKENARSRKEKSAKAYRIQRIQKATEFKEMHLEEVSLCARSKLYLFPNV